MGEFHDPVQILKSRNEALSGLNSKVPFFLDTNILLRLAIDDTDLMNRIITCPQFTYTLVNKEEISHIARNEKNEQDKAKLIAFLDKISKYKKPVQFSNKEVRKVLQELLEILPRKLVDDMMIHNDDSYLNNLIERLKFASIKSRAGKLTSDDMDNYDKKAKAEFEKLPGTIKGYARQRFKFFGVNTNKINLTNYDAAIDGFIHKNKDFIHKLIQSAKGIDEMITILEGWERKSYTQDMNQVENVIVAGLKESNNVKSGSIDNDVSTLLELYAAKVGV
jgi:predicted nucleic acid-binding protein